MNYELGKCNLQKLLKEKGWTQTHFAERMGWERQRVNGYCKKERTMSVAVLFSVADTLDVDPRDIYDLEIKGGIKL
jgi:transcriptional regulator with XRE-family HTH domain